MSLAACADNHRIYNSRLQSNDMDSDIPDYTDDWKKYWSAKFESREKRRLKSAAETPEQEFLTADVRELNPEGDEYDYEIDLEMLRLHPDSILNDAKKGFAAFVDEADIDDAEERNYDILPIHIVGLGNHRFNSRSFNPYSFDGLLRTNNNITHFKAAIQEVSEREYKATSIGFRCPSGHTTRLVQPAYTTYNIQTCSDQDCTNTVFPISRKTTARDIVRFQVEYDGECLKCVATGQHTRDRQYNNLSDAEGKISLTGIVRKIPAEDGTITPVYEVLYLDDRR